MEEDNTFKAVTIKEVSKIIKNLNEGAPESPMSQIKTSMTLQIQIGSSASIRRCDKYLGECEGIIKINSAT